MGMRRYAPDFPFLSFFFLIFDFVLHGTLERFGALKLWYSLRKGIPLVRRRDIGLAKSVEADICPTARQNLNGKIPGLFVRCCLQHDL